MITSFRNDRVLQVRRLVADASERRRSGLCVLEGVKACADHLSWGGAIELALMAPHLLELDGGPQLAGALEVALSSRPGALLLATDDVVAAAGDAQSSQGVVFVVPRPDTSGLPRPEGTAVLVAWELQDPGNVGTLARTAEAAGCSALVVARGAGGAVADPYSPRAVRAAAGSSFRIALHEWIGAPGALAEELTRAGFTLAPCVPQGGLAPERATLAGSVALVFGSEAHGLPDALVAEEAARVTIPLAGRVESLNAAAAAAVVAFEAARQRREGPEREGVLRFPS